MAEKVPGRAASGYARAAALSPERRREIGRIGAAANNGHRGESNPNAKLTADSVRQIKDRIASGETNAQIAASYPVSRDLIQKIRVGKVWRSVPDAGNQQEQP